MKKIMLSLVLIISVMLIVSCRSTQTVDDTFSRTYNKYFNQLNLNGADKYTVRSGDTLSHIANSFYGDGFYYPVIMLASKDIVLDPDKIQPGMVLTIPDLERNMNFVVSRAAMKGVIQDCAVIEDNRGRHDTAAGLRQLAQKIDY